MEQIITTQTVAVMLFVVIVALTVNITLLTLKTPHTKVITNYWIKQLKERYPDVAEKFMLKDTEEQLIENNQEIHDLNKRISFIEDKIAGMLEKLDGILNKLS